MHGLTGRKAAVARPGKLASLKDSLMTEPLPRLSMTSLQHRLDALKINDELTIGIGDYRRLFGVNDVATARLSNFAEGHGCTVDPRIAAVTFRKVRAHR